MAIRIPLTAVESSNLHEIGYDQAQAILAVSFKSGDLWYYRNYPAAMWQELLEAPSKGSYYSLNIRGKFAGEKMTGECPKCGYTGFIGDKCEDCGCDTYAGPLKHALLWEHPDAQSKRKQPTDCGQYVPPSEIAANVDAITCPRCREIVESL